MHARRYRGNYNTQTNDNRRSLILFASSSSSSSFPESIGSLFFATKQKQQQRQQQQQPVQKGTITIQGHQYSKDSLEDLMLQRLRDAEATKTSRSSNSTSRGGDGGGVSGSSTVDGTRVENKRNDSDDDDEEEEGEGAILPMTVKLDAEDYLKAANNLSLDEGSLVRPSLFRSPSTSLQTQLPAQRQQQQREEAPPTPPPTPARRGRKPKSAVSSSSSSKSNIGAPSSASSTTLQQQQQQQDEGQTPTTKSGRKRSIAATQLLSSSSSLSSRASSASNVSKDLSPSSSSLSASSKDTSGTRPSSSRSFLGEVFQSLAVQPTEPESCKASPLSPPSAVGTATTTLTTTATTTTDTSRTSSELPDDLTMNDLWNAIQEGTTTNLQTISSEELHQQVFAHEQGFLKQSQLFKESLSDPRVAQEAAAVRRGAQFRQRLGKAVQTLEQDVDTFVNKTLEQQQQQMAMNETLNASLYNRCPRCRCIWPSQDMKMARERGRNVCQICFAELVYEQYAKPSRVQPSRSYYSTPPAWFQQRLSAEKAAGSRSTSSSWTRTKAATKIATPASAPSSLPSYTDKFSQADAAREGGSTTTRTSSSAMKLPAPTPPPLSDRPQPSRQQQQQLGIPNQMMVSPLQSHNHRTGYTRGDDTATTASSSSTWNDSFRTSSNTSTTSRRL